MKSFRYHSFFSILIISILGVQFLNAQKPIQPYMRWITEEDGLPSNELYHVMQDDKGFMWFASDDGIIKFDGKNMSIFNKSNGLPENVVFRLYNVGNGKIIGECLTNKYFTLFNDKIIPFKFNDSITKHLGSANISFSYAEDKNRNHHFGTRSGMYLFNSKGDLLKSPSVFFYLHDFPVNGVVFSHINNTWLAGKEAVNKNPQNSNSNFHLRFSNDGRSYYYQLPKNLLDQKFGNSTHVVEIEKDKLCFNYGKGIFLIGKEGVISIKSFNSATLDLFYEDGYVYVCTQYHGVYQLKIEGNKLKEMNHFLDGFSVTSGMRSLDGSFWFTTREGGVVQIPQMNLQIDFDVSDDNISALSISPKLKMVGTEKGLIYMNGKIIQKLNRIITDFLSMEDESFIALGMSNVPLVFSSIKDHYNWNRFKTHKDFFPFQHGMISNNMLISANISIFFIFDMNKNSFVKIGRWGKSKREKIHSIFSTNRNVYFAASDGLFKVDVNTGKILKKYLSDEIICLQKFKDGILGFSSTGTIYYLKDDKVKKLELPKFQMINRYYTFFIEGNILLASNNLGVYKWSISDELDFSLQDYTPLPRVNFIKSQGNYWYFATKKMVLTEKKNKTNQVKPKLQFNSILKNGKSVNHKDQHEFKYESNNFQFNFQTIDFRSKFAFYKYKLENHDVNFLYGSTNIVNYSALPPGNYTFRVSVTTDGFRFSDEEKYSFTIYPPFWKTTWFILLSIFCTLVTIFSFIYLRIKRHRERFQIEKMIATLRSQALTTQLNPHLIFNILNSIQGMVSEGEIENVNTYIAKFSKFMRRTLNMSKRELVSIVEEIENTIQYTELEKLRFIESVQFEFLINITNQNLKVPPMIIQPLIENAIKHGIMPKMVNQGKIIVRIWEEEKSLFIQVEDDGIGFLSTNINGDGLRITKERLEVISPQNQLKIISQIAPTIVQIIYHK